MTPLPDLTEVGGALESAVQAALEALEQNGVSAKDADEFIRDCVFNAWWGWNYEPAALPLREPGAAQPDGSRE